MTTTSELKSTAFHEAGHAVACLELGRGFRYVTIVPDPDDNSLGHVKFTRWRLQFDENSPLTPRLQQTLERDIVIAMAGPYAEERFAGVYNEAGAGSDHQSAVEASLFINDGDTDGAGLHWAWLSYKAKRLFDHPCRWITVQALAAELMKDNTLNSRRVKQIVGRATTEACARHAQHGKWIDLYGREIPDEWELVETTSETT